MTTEKTEFNLRADQWSRFETEIVLPLALVVSVAVIVLYSSAGTVPGQFSGRHFSIAWWAAVLCGLILLAVIGLRLQRPRQYEISENGLDTVLPLLRFRIPLSEIKEVCAVSERSNPAGLPSAIAGAPARVVQGFQSIFLRLQSGSAVVQPKAEHLDYTTAATGGVEVVCKNGQTALFSPSELSPFLNEIEYQLKRAHSEAKVVREARVQIGL